MVVIEMDFRVRAFVTGIGTERSGVTNQWRLVVD